MRKRISILLWAVVLLPSWGWTIKESVHPLFQYVYRPDPAYSWEKIGEEKWADGGRLIKIRMTSQVWQGIKWQHELYIVLPAKIQDGGVAGLLITGSGRGGIVDILRIVANRVGIPMAVIFDIPNQPLFGGKTEDALLAHTFLQALRTGDMTWLALYPMTKSVVRAMDTISAISEREWGRRTNRFVVTGASKRGWTTWFTGIVDSRVIGIAPMVYDNLDIPAQMAQQLACYGTYSEQIEDYTTTGLVQMLSDPKGQWFSKMIDPYVFHYRVTVPKFIINGSNDPYWTLESANLYYPHLLNEKHILYVPNAGHDLGNGISAVSAIAAFARARAKGDRLPMLTWVYEIQGDRMILRIKPEGNPLKVRVWVATSPSLDFRKAKWSPTELSPKDGRYEFEVVRPKEGYVAMFGEAVYQYDGIEYSQCTTPKILK